MNRGWRAACLCLLLSAVPFTSHAATLVRVGWLRGTNDLTLSKARGTLDRALAAQGDTVEWDGPFPAGAPAMEALNAGAIDITLGSSTSAIPALAAHAPAVVFAYQAMGPDAEALLVHRDSAIHSVAELAGHSVAVNRGGTGEYLLLRALQLHGVDPARVTRIYLGPADAGPAFASGAVDAWIAWDPFLTVALDHYDARVLANGPAMGSQNAIVMLASRDFTERHPALLKLIYTTLLADNSWAVAHPAEAGAIWASELHMPPAAAAGFGARDAVPTVAVGPAQQDQMQAVAAWFAQAGLVTTPPDMARSSTDLSR